MSIQLLSEEDQNSHNDSDGATSHGGNVEMIGRHNVF